MRSINRCTVLTGKIALAFAFALCATLVPRQPVGAQTAGATYHFEGQRFTFTHLDATHGGTAIALQDRGLQQLFRRLGISVTWKPGERYVLLTTAQPQIISFTVGDPGYNVGPIAATARFAPYLLGGDVYLPWLELMHALDLAPKATPTGRILQPQIGTIDIQAKNDVVNVVAFAATALHPRLLERIPSAVAYAFDGVGTPLIGERVSHLPGLRGVVVTQRGKPAHPVTIVRLLLAPGATVLAPGTDDGRDAVLALRAGTQIALGPTPSAASTTAPAPSLTPVNVTGVTGESLAGGYSLNIAVDANASYTWHQLRPPDNRFWIDIHGAHLQMLPADYRGAVDVSVIRIRQLDAQTVRVALSLYDPKEIDVIPTAHGVTVNVTPDDQVADTPHDGAGTIGSMAGTVAIAPVSAQTEPWKYGYVPTHPRLIVIDPGHGGSDRGAVRHGIAEAALTLDMAKRLRAILISRGWHVVMTRTADVDVYAPNDTAPQELQARDDIANNDGARLLISIHANSFINSGPSGTTTYYAKPTDLAFARAIQAELAARLGTKNDGVVKSRFYIPLHGLMPAILIETAFLSNPSDFRKLTNPQWRELVAEAIADGVADYAGTPTPSASQPAQ